MGIIKENNKFRDSRNRLTFAGLSCGYIEVTDTPDYRIKLDAQHGVIFVSIYVSFPCSVAVAHREFHSFQHRRADAYKFYRAKCREFAKQYPQAKTASSDACSKK